MWPIDYRVISLPMPLDDLEGTSLLLIDWNLCISYQWSN